MSPERSQWSWTGLNAGLWSAVLATVWTVWFLAAFPAWMASLPAWQGIEAYASAFDPVSYMAWVIPCFLLSITFPILVAAIYLYLPVDRRVPGLQALVFAIVYGAILSADYFVLGTLVRDALQAGQTEGLEMLVIGSPHSLTNALEGVGYFFMGLSTLFAGLAWRVPGRLRRATRWLLIINGIASLLGVALGALGVPAAAMASLVIWGVTFPVATALLAWRFRHDLRVAPVSSRVVRV